MIDVWPVFLPVFNFFGCRGQTASAIFRATFSAGVTGFHNRGVKEAGYLVLWKTAMPSILFETWFLSNPKDLEYLGTNFGRAQMAHALYKSVIEYKETYEKQPK